MSSACIQESFFSAALRGRRHVTVCLVNGARVTGTVRSYDKYSVILEEGNQEQLIFKHSISAAFLCHKAQCRACWPEPESPAFAHGAD